MKWLQTKMRNSAWLALLATAAVLFAPVLLLAANGDFVALAPIPGLTDNSADLNVFLNAAFRFGLIVAAFLAVIMIVVGGLEYMTSESFGRKSAGKDKMWSAFWGLILILSSYLILFTINPHIVSLDLFGTVERSEAPPPQEIPTNPVNRCFILLRGGNENESSSARECTERLDEYRATWYTSELFANKTAEAVRIDEILRNIQNETAHLEIELDSANKEFAALTDSLVDRPSQAFRSNPPRSADCQSSEDSAGFFFVYNRSRVGNFSSVEQCRSYPSDYKALGTMAAQLVTNEERQEVLLKDKVRIERELRQFQGFCGPCTDG